MGLVAAGGTPVVVLGVLAALRAVIAPALAALETVVYVALLAGGLDHEALPAGGAVAQVRHRAVDAHAAGFAVVGRIVEEAHAAVHADLAVDLAVAVFALAQAVEIRAGLVRLHRGIQAVAAFRAEGVAFLVALEADLLLALHAFVRFYAEHLSALLAPLVVFSAVQTHVFGGDRIHAGLIEACAADVTMPVIPAYGAAVAAVREFSIHKVQRFIVGHVRFVVIRRMADLTGPMDRVLLCGGLQRQDLRDQDQAQQQAQQLPADPSPVSSHPFHFLLLSACFRRRVAVLPVRARVPMPRCGFITQIPSCVCGVLVSCSKNCP